MPDRRRSPVARALPWVALCLALAVVNVWRTAHWLAFAPPPAEIFMRTGVSQGGERVGWAGPVWLGPAATVRIPGYPWRPFRASLRLCAPKEAPSGGLSVRVNVNGVPAADLVVPEACVSHDLVVSPARNRDPAIEFLSQPEVGVASVALAPVLTAAEVTRHALIGALAGAVVWLLFAGPFPRKEAVAGLTRDTSPEARPAAWWSRRRATWTFVLLLTYFGVWAVLKPPLQAPDEPQHLIRANSVLQQPWVARPDWLRVDARFANPLAIWTPAPLAALFFRGDHFLTPAQIEEVRATPWHIGVPPPEWSMTPLSTYPTGYYAPAFAAGQLTTWAFGASPYQSVYAHRFWSLLAAAILWTLVYRTLRSMPEAHGRATAVLAFLVLNPMIGFVSSSVTPDSVNIPLGALAVLLSYQVIVHGSRRGAATAALAACALTKPSALLIAGSLSGAATLFLLAGQVSRERFLSGVVWLGRVLVCCFVVFYAWSPPRFMAGPPIEATLRQYLGLLAYRLPSIWVLYWGRPGWADYQVPGGWYLAIAILVALSLLLMWRSMTHGRRLAVFCLLTLVGYLFGMVIGEYHYFPVAGVNFQGRHVLPASIGLCGLVMHEAVWVRRAFIGFLGVFNLTLMHQSFVRYFAADWTALWLSLP